MIVFVDIPIDPDRIEEEFGDLLDPIVDRLAEKTGLPIRNLVSFEPFEFRVVVDL